MNLYDVLGVAPDAAPDDVRAAYRRAARAHHPDAHGDAAAERMAAINGAWHILGHPQRRAEYDRTLTHTAPAPTASNQPAARPAQQREPRHNPLARYQNPPRFPWRPMLAIGAIASVLVLVTSALRTEPTEPPVDHILDPGDCVEIEPNGDAAEVSCNDPHDAVVETLVPLPEDCRPGTDAHRDRQGMGIACVVAG